MVNAGVRALRTSFHSLFSRKKTILRMVGGRAPKLCIESLETGVSVWRLEMVVGLGKGLGAGLPDGWRSGRSLWPGCIWWCPDRRCTAPAECLRTCRRLCRISWPVSCLPPWCSLGFANRRRRIPKSWLVGLVLKQLKSALMIRLDLGRLPLSKTR